MLWYILHAIDTTIYSAGEDHKTDKTTCTKSINEFSLQPRYDNYTEHDQTSSQTSPKNRCEKSQWLRKLIYCCWRCKSSLTQGVTTKLLSSAVLSCCCAIFRPIPAITRDELLKISGRQQKPRVLHGVPNNTLKLPVICSRGCSKRAYPCVAAQSW